VAVTAELVKNLRERTGLGMMECKKALVETDGNIELAIENLRKSGLAKAAKKAGRVAAEGLILCRVVEGFGVAIEVNSETDFVARDHFFIEFVNRAIDVAAKYRLSTIDSLMSYALNPEDCDSEPTLETARLALIQRVGENIQVRRVHALEGSVVGSYEHAGKIGVLAALTEGTSELAREVCMHVAASSPLVVNQDQVPQESIDKEREIFSVQAKESGKPDDIVNKMIEGRVKKYLAEVSLNDQAFIKNPDIKVGDFVKQNGGGLIQSFLRLEVGDWGTEELSESGE
jgi:elongation factor Ts